MGHWSRRTGVQYASMRLMADLVLGELVRTYLQRVVSDRDLTAFDDMVSADYLGSGPGWPGDRDGLRAFYQSQATLRPDWHIDVRETVEVGEWVAVRAHAGGTVAHDKLGAGLQTPFLKAIDWLAVFRVVNGRIVETRLLSAIEG
jgi:hypothetical protein